MADAFISYSHSDRAFAIRLQHAVRDAGRTIWVDESDIPSGAKWKEDLNEAIQDADCFLLLVSPSCAGSDQCRNEVEYASSLNKRIIPIHFLPTPTTSLPGEIQAIQFVPPRGVFDDPDGGNTFESSLALLITAIDTDIDAAREHTFWGKRALEWEKNAKDRSYLLSGSSLAAAEAWLVRNPEKGPQPTELQRHYILAGRQAATRRQRRLLLGVSTALVGALVLALVAVVQRSHAVTEARIAQSDELAADAINLLPTNTALAMRASLQAYDTSPTPQARNALNTVAESPLIAILPRGSAPSSAATYGNTRADLFAVGDARGTIQLWRSSSSPKVIATRHVTGSVTSLAFSHTDTILASGSSDGTISVWNRTTGVTKILHLGSSVTSLSFGSGDSQLVAGGGTSVEMWTVSGWSPSLLPDIRAPVTSVALSPSGSSIAIGTASMTTLTGSGTTAILWNLTTQLPGGPGLSDSKPVTSVCFGFGGQVLAATDSGGYVNLWVTASGEPVDKPLPDGSSAESVAFRDDGGLLASGTSSGEVVFWSLSDPQGTSNAPVDKIIPPFADGSSVTDLSFSHSGMTLLTRDASGNTALWDLQNVDLPPPDTTGDKIDSIAISPDGKTLAAGHVHGMITFQKTDNGASAGPPLQLGYEVHSVAFSPDGTLLAAADAAPGISLWEVGKSGSITASGPQLNDVTAHGDIYAVAFSPRGHRFASGDNGSLLKLWNTASTDTSALFHSNHASGPIRAVVFSPDGRLVATAGEAGVITIRAARTGARIGPSFIEGSKVNSLAFSPNSKTLAAGDDAGNVQLWSIAEKGTSGPPLRDRSPVNSVAFSPDGQTVSTGDSAGLIVSWDVATGTQVGTPIDAGTEVDAIAFTNDGSVLAAGDNAGVVHFYRADFLTRSTATVSSQLCHTMGQSVTPSQWTSALPNIPEHDVCHE
jgi:WD40 repeat protein